MGEDIEKMKKNNSEIISISKSKLKKKNKISKKQKIILIIITTILILTITYITILQLEKKYNINFKKIFTKIFEKLEKIHEKNPIEFLFFIFLFQFLDMILILPFYTISNIIFAYLIKDFYLSCVILTVIPLICSVLMFFALGKGCITMLKNKLSHYDAYNVLIHNTDTNPLILCMIVRFLYIPLGSKEYIVLVLDYPFYAVFISGAIFFISHSVIFSAIGIHLNGIADSLKKKSLNDMDKTEKIEFVSVCVFLGMTFFIFFYLNVWLNRQMKERPAYKDYSRYSIQSLPANLGRVEVEEDKKILIKSLY